LCTELLNYLKIDLGAKFQELDLAEWFSQNIPQLLFSADELHLNLSCVCILPDQVESKINVLGPVMMHWILDQ